MVALLFSSTALASITACAPTLGPRTVPQARFDYNRAVARSWDEQLLLNLVRLRYRDTPHFLELESVVAQYERTGSASLSPLLVDGGSNELGAGLGVELAERPTLTFTPLEGEAFVHRLLTPLSPVDLILLSQAGWSISRLMDCCVQDIRGPGVPPVRNAPRAAGPTPDLLRRDEYESFQGLSHDLRELQLAGALHATLDTTPETPSETGSKSGSESEPRSEPGSGDAPKAGTAKSTDSKSWEVILTIEPAAGIEEPLRRVRETLGLDPEVASFRLVSERGRLDRNEIAVTGRSLLGVLFFVSQAVQIPPADETAGRVTITRTESGERLDWQEVTGAVLTVRSSPTPPEDAAVRVPYRGVWFYLDDADLQSKSTFLLLSQLFSLQAGSGSGRSPLLTVSAGGG